MEPLPAGDPRYEPFLGLRGSGDVAERMASDIRFSDYPVHLLFSGHGGGGKSTELERLRHRLENPKAGEDRFFVVYFEADYADIDVNDVDFLDVLLAMLRHVAQTLRVELGIELRPTWLNRFLGDWKQLLGSDVEIEKLELDAKFAKFTAAIKTSPDVRHKIRASLEPHVSNLLQEANNLLDEARSQLRSKERGDLVLIVDNLDRIILRDVPNSGFNTQEQLFVNRGAQMAAINCHVVYTLPISVVFSPRAPALQTIFGCRPEILPMVKVFDQDGKDHEAGLEAMRQMVGRRLEKAEFPEAEAFDTPGTIRHLCRVSGGHQRNLMILIRSAIVEAGQPPIMRAHADLAAQALRNGFQRALSRPEYFEVLRAVDQTHEMPGTEHDQLLLQNHFVLEYCNGDPWYAVNPVIRDLSRFRKSAGGKKRRTP
jgi:hypothetical protein